MRFEEIPVKFIDLSAIPPLTKPQSELTQMFRPRLGLPVRYDKLANNTINLCHARTIGRISSQHFYFSSVEMRDSPQDVVRHCRLVESVCNDPLGGLVAGRIYLSRADIRTRQETLNVGPKPF